MKTILALLFVTFAFLTACADDASVASLTVAVEDQETPGPDASCYPAPDPVECMCLSGWPEATRLVCPPHACGVVHNMCGDSKCCTGGCPGRLCQPDEPTP